MPSQKLEFTQSGDFEAMYAAEDWCKANGYSVGRNERDQPRGLLLGNYDIAKWRNLSPDDKKSLDGVMAGDMRSGPVVVEIYDKSHTTD